MDIHSLTYFKKTAELQHMTRAAEALRVAQPSLSRTIAALEGELGVQLFDRVGKNILLNPYGEIVLRHTNTILRELEDIHTELAEARDESRRSVSISVYAASKLLPLLVKEFKREYPSIVLHIVQGDLADRGEEYDLSIYSSLQPGSGLHQEMLIEEDILLALPVSNPLSSRESLDLREVAQEEFICLQKGKSLRSITDNYCKVAGFDPNVILECDSPETVRELISAGVGISFIPMVTWSGMESDSVRLVPISFPQCRRYINLSWREHGYLSPAAVLFRDFVRAYFRQKADQ